MTTGRLTQGLTTLLLAGVAVLGMSASAAAQSAGDYPPVTPPGQGGDLPPGQDTPPGQRPEFNCPNPSGNSGGNCPRGGQMSASVPNDTFDPGSNVRVGVESTYQFIKNVTATPQGAARVTFTIPTNLPNGVHHVIFSGTKSGQAVEGRIPFTVEGSVAASTRGRALPRTGSDDLLALSIAGGTMVLVGGGVVVAARRRRDGQQFAAA